MTRVTFQAPENIQEIPPATHIVSLNTDAEVLVEPAPVNGATHVEFDDEPPALEAARERPERAASAKSIC